MGESTSAASDIYSDIRIWPSGPDAQPATEYLYLDVYKAPRERAVYLLKIAAEVEHALLVQYLFAAWSLGGPSVRDQKQIDLLSAWRSTILEIAREEMGHLATVENLLTLIGGELSFARKDCPASGNLYPFKFELEPLTKHSLAKYLLSEMPSDAVLAKLGLTDKIEKIRKNLGAEGPAIHRVGKLYDAIKDLFTAPQIFLPQTAGPQTFVAQTDIQPDAAAYMVRPSEWGLGNQCILIRAPRSRQDAINAITDISDQGEGSDITDFPRSHFARFLNIYDKFPSSGWVPARNLAKNPTTDCDARPARLIANAEARDWAKLFNLRYRMLLMFLSHSFAIAAPHDSTKKSPRGLLISWAFGEMYHLRSVAEFLMSMPLGGNSQYLAGPPFEMPTSLGLAMREPDRWRLHRDLMLETEYYVDKLLRSSLTQAQNVYLLGLRHTNGLALEQAITMVGA
jgi:hypothetical protein